MKNSDREFLQSVKYGLIAVDEAGEVLHFCGYQDTPTIHDRQSLSDELKADRSFGLVERGDWTIVDAPQEVVDAFHTQAMKDFTSGRLLEHLLRVWKQ